MINFEALLQRVLAYNPKADAEMLRKSYIFSREAHCSQRRVEGSPYIHHPLAVGELLADMKLDTSTIAAGLLHDTIEDTGMRAEDISDIFGTEIAFLVEAVTKLSKVEFQTKEDAQAENMRKMLLAMSKDVRVILIKFADRLHNMRTLEFLAVEKQRRIAVETLEIYAPLANRLGISWLRNEFEDLCFKALHPDIYLDLEQRVAKQTEERAHYLEEVKSIVGDEMTKADIPAKIKWRIKHYYGIYQKMVKQKVDFEQVYDVMGIRIITDTVGHCYDILGILHSLWRLVPGRFKDFISLPKSNMYQSLHTTVVGPGGDRVEFQIRTEEMNVIAEDGIAAHWRYKEKKESIDRKNARFIQWLRELVKDSSDAKEFLEAVKGEVMPDTLYVFTPRGDIKELPVGSTPIDFAFSIHTEVGNKCVGARVNGRIVPLRHKLESGDVCEIVTGPSHGPSKDWLKYVVTQRARSKIKQYIRSEERKQGMELGTKLLEEEMRRHDLPMNMLKSKKLEPVITAFGLQSTEDLCVLIGYGKISAHQVVNRLSSGEEAEKPEELPVQKGARPSRGKKSIITIKGVDNVLYHIGKCCFPVPGDRVVGFITKGKGVTIHRRECLSLERSTVDNERLIEVEWAQEDESTSPARLYIEGVDKPGLLADLSALITSADVNINSVKADTSRDKRALMEVILEVKDRRQLSNLIAKLSHVDGVVNIRR